MNVNLFVNECGDLEMDICPEDISTIKIFPVTLTIAMQCYHCKGWMYDEHRRAGHFYCMIKRNRTIPNIRSVPKWCPKYKYILEVK